MSEKKGAISLVAVLKAKGIRHIVLCPGSRNAPLIDAFSSDNAFTCYSIVDERSAGFFAIGISQVIRDTVVVCCTSGTALLNLAPAVAEAHFQNCSLLIVSADRPAEWVNQGESQTIDQHRVFENFIRGSFTLIQEPESADDTWFHDRQINEAVNLTRQPGPGPVHINIPFREPLYSTSRTFQPKVRTFEETAVEAGMTASVTTAVLNEWNAAKNTMIICGQGHPDPKLEEVLNKLAAAGVVVLTETTSNLHGDDFFPCIDKLIVGKSDNELEHMKPDLLITLGGPLVSRKVKAFLRKFRPGQHWHVDPVRPDLDAYQSLTRAFCLTPHALLNTLTPARHKPASFMVVWNRCKTLAEKRHEDLLKAVAFSDLKVFDMIIRYLPERAFLQIGNSSAIRYAQLFDSRKRFTTYGNRGTSGIEGCLSTAAGASAVYNDTVFHITGDLSLMYDSNGLWNNYLTNRLRIIVINNGGGGIFRIIDGPSAIHKFEEYIETTHQMNFSKLAALYNLTYFTAENEAALEKGMKALTGPQAGPALFEIKTPRLENHTVLMNYFDQLNTMK